ncbi:cobyric acid synthase [Natrarchaeobius chitinivorans]|uniref:Probable cobyric acid synthase n=1 Tax=Natrarchaeobius chitinivorans TaxID=1679083 RepID=A0A3N6MDY8_NATCH|nr:cobyric acid synthase [Natrarchaeobius chitinivorans]RQG93791.1 cobyric acid synthase [Natrarchaeobius chitinivorans]
MTRTLLVAGTASHVGKSTVAAGLCRLLADRGVSVAPFKAQNMSNNARVVVRPDGAPDNGARDDVAGNASGAERNDRLDAGNWGEIGVSQFVQARAARTTPTTDCNPVLLKPRGDGESQLVIDGVARGHMAAGSYYEDHWERARTVAEAAYRRLAADHDVIVAEGAGSIAEINLHDRDLANVETARFADADIVLLVDIERGGAFASLYGTLELVPEALNERVVGAAITKFRGDPSLLEPGIREIEARTGVPIVGVIPYDDPGLPEEDSVSLPDSESGGVLGDDDGVPDDRRVTVAVPRLPRLSNATDIEALADESGVSVAFVPVDPNGIDASSETSGNPFRGVDADAVLIPGTKNTVDDLLALRKAGFEEFLRDFDGPIVGICGGYQILGERITNASLEGVGTAETVEGLGLLPVETRFESEKHLERTSVPVDGSVTPVLAGADGTASGYEIHAGRTRVLEGADVGRPLGDSSAASGLVLGTYLHGLFDNDAVRKAFIASAADDASPEGPTRGERPVTPSPAGRERGRTPYDRAATLVGDHLDLDALGGLADVWTDGR